MKIMHQPMTPIRRRRIHWELLGLHGPAVTSIEEIRRQVISASNSGLSTVTVPRGQKMEPSHHSAAQSATTHQMRRAHP